MNAWERFNAAMNFKPFDRLPVIELCSWWGETLERWRGEGLPRELTDRYDICRHFGLDIIYQHWLPLALPGLPSPKAHGEGIVTGMDSYRDALPYLYPAAKKDFLDESALRRWNAERNAGDAVMRLNLEGFFWFPRRLLGIESHLYAFYDQPELMHAINSDLLSFLLRAVDAVCETCKPDFVVVDEDMSYNNGPMLSKGHFDEFLLPYYRKLIPCLKERGIMVILDSDGDISVPAAWFDEAGFDGVLPLERQAGVDLAELRARFPKMRFIGGFDKMTMNKGEAAMRGEFERLLPVASGGGFVLSCDHQTPPGVSYADYQLYLRLFREYAVKAGGR